MNELTNETIQKILQTAHEAEREPRELDNVTIRGLLSAAKQAEAVAVEAPQVSLLDAFMATLPSQAWVGDKLAALWKTFPVAMTLFAIVISIVY